MALGQKYAPSPLLRKYVEAGWYGRKKRPWILRLQPAPIGEGMSDYQTLEVKVSDRKWNHYPQPTKSPQRHQPTMVKELGRVLESWKNLELRAVILTGSGRAFAAGADITQMESFTALDAQHSAQVGQSIFRQLEHFLSPNHRCCEWFCARWWL